MGSLCWEREHEGSADGAYTNRKLVATAVQCINEA